MSRISREIVAEVEATYGAYYEKLSRMPAAKLAHDVLSEEKVHGQIRLLAESIGTTPEGLRGRRILDVGSGFGIFVAVACRDYGIDAHGIEPAGDGFDSTYTLSQRILRGYGVDADRIRAAPGEANPHATGTFEAVFSSTVIEHTKDPEAVVREGVRVLKPGGHMHFVFPNYGSFIEGHYAVPWIPHMGHAPARAWLRLWGRDPHYMDTIQLITFRDARRWVARMPDVDVVSYGQEVFRRRLVNADVPPWGGLSKLRPIVAAFRRLHLLRFAAWLLIAIGAHEPVILTLRKKPV